MAILARIELAFPPWQGDVINHYTKGPQHHGLSIVKRLVMGWGVSSPLRIRLVGVEPTFPRFQNEWTTVIPQPDELGSAITTDVGFQPLSPKRGSPYLVSIFTLTSFTIWCGQCDLNTRLLAPMVVIIWSPSKRSTRLTYTHIYLFFNSFILSKIIFSISCLYGECIYLWCVGHKGIRLSMLLFFLSPSKWWVSKTFLSSHIKHFLSKFLKHIFL